MVGLQLDGVAKTNGPTAETSARSCKNEELFDTLEQQAMNMGEVVIFIKGSLEVLTSDYIY